MNLHRRERDYYVLNIESAPQLTGWEASFDGGTTWLAGTAHATSPRTWQWLLAGDLATQGTAVATITATVTPLIAADDGAARVVETAPTITLTGA